MLPSEEKHDCKYANKPTKIRFVAMDVTNTVKLKSFQEDYIYISFESESGVQIEISFKAQPKPKQVFRFNAISFKKNDGPAPP